VEEECARHANRVWNECHHKTTVEIAFELLRQLEDICQLGYAKRPSISVTTGINDAIALKTANVSISLRGAFLILATDTAPIVLMDESLEQLPYLLQIAKEFKSHIDTTFIITIVPNMRGYAGAFAPKLELLKPCRLQPILLASSTGSHNAPARQTRHEQAATTAKNIDGVINNEKQTNQISTSFTSGRFYGLGLLLPAIDRLRKGGVAAGGRFRRSPFLVVLAVVTTLEKSRRSYGLCPEIAIPPNRAVNPSILNLSPSIKKAKIPVYLGSPQWGAALRTNLITKTRK
jgi:hypothetical protein